MTEQLTLMFRRVSQVALVVKKLPANAGEVRSLGREDHLDVFFVGFLKFPRKGARDSHAI